MPKPITTSSFGNAIFKKRTGGIIKTLTTKQIKKLFGDFEYSELSKGRIKILGDWVKENIVRIELPIVGYTRCHKEIYFDLFRIFYRLEKNGHADKIDTHDFRIRGGCFVPRHMCWNPERGISRHSWGVAIDLNVSTNSYGSAGTMHKAIIDMFADFGFFWGGNWRTSDPMHFEVGDKWKPFKLITEVKK